MSDLETLKRLLDLDKAPMTLRETKDAWEDVEYWAATHDWPGDCGPHIHIHPKDLIQVLRLLVDGYSFLAKEISSDTSN